MICPSNEYRPNFPSRCTALLGGARGVSNLNLPEILLDRASNLRARFPEVRRCYFANELILELLC